MISVNDICIFYFSKNSTNEFWNFDVLGDILVWKVQLLTLEEEASSMTFNSTDKLSIYSIQVPVSMVH